jgi:ketosteroid isomerase-like protein
MSQTADLFREGVRRALTGDHQGYLALLADDVTFEFPFAPAGRPRRVAGKDDLICYLAPLIGGYDGASLAALTVYETDAPDTIVAEMAIAFPGRPEPRPFVAVVRSAGGTIVSYRDYWAPSA